MSRGLIDERLKQVRAPAGMDISASSPEEIAVSILAQIVQLSRAQTINRKKPAASPVELPMELQEAKDPICGMTVNVTTAKHKSEYDGREFYFCCAGCKQKFDRQPDLFVASHASA
ncbi:MAG: YHS domain-containing protein [Acidobacteriaceae bacterium]